MSLVGHALIAGAIALAAVAALYAWSASRRSRTPGSPLSPADQGPRGGHLGWFEGRWARVLHADVLYAVVVTREQLVLLRIGGQWSGPHHGYSNKIPRSRVFAMESSRRSDYANELAAAPSPSVLLGRHARDLAVPLCDIRRAVLRPATGWARAGWKGPAELVIERCPAPVLKLVIEDAWQLAACAKALELVLAGALRVDPLLKPLLRDADAGVRRVVVRTEAFGGIVLGILCAFFAALMFGILALQTDRRPLEAATGHLMSCQTIARPRTGPILRMVLDAPPYELDLDIERQDVPELRDACRTHAYVNIVYRNSAVGGPARAQAIGYVAGPDIVSEEDGARRERSSDVGAAAIGGASAGLAIGFVTAALRWPRRSGVGREERRSQR